MQAPIKATMIEPIMPPPAPSPRRPNTHPDLRKKTTLTELASGSMQKLREIETNVRSDRREFLTELFRNSPDPIDLIKKKDLHDLLDDAVDRLIEVTQTLARVILKNA
jgi:hypothetical protein